MTQPDRLAEGAQVGPADWGRPLRPDTAASDLSQRYLRAEDISKEFEAPDGQLVEVLSHVSCDISKGDFVSIVGPSGCGKSTLLQIMGGLLTASGGAVWLGESQLKSPSHDVIYVFQQYTRSLYPWKTVLQNVSFGAENRGMRRRDAQKLSLEYIDLVELHRFRDYYPWQLSGGMQQRVAIARALACQANVLLMDEPFSSVDALTRATLEDLLLDLWGKLGVTVVFVTHDTDEAIYLSRRVLVMSQSPGVFTYEAPIQLDYPRHQVLTKEEPTYLELRHEVLGRLMGEIRETAQ